MKYEGRDAAPNGHERYALMYGPILVAATGGGLHFSVEGQPKMRFAPYYEIEDEISCCYPTVSGCDLIWMFAFQPFRGVTETGV